MKNSEANSGSEFFLIFIFQSFFSAENRACFFFFEKKIKKKLFNK